jgi:hypothetical protein
MNLVSLVFALLSAFSAHSSPFVSHRMDTIGGGPPRPAATFAPAAEVIVPNDTIGGGPPK